MRVLDQPIRRRYLRETEPSRFPLALACAVALNALLFGLTVAAPQQAVSPPPRVMRLSALRQVSKMASYAQRAIAALPASAPASGGTVHSSGRWSVSVSSSAPARGWAWPVRTGAASGAAVPGGGRRGPSAPSLAGPAATWSGPVAQGGAGPAVGPVARGEGGGGAASGAAGPGGYGAEPASVGTRTGSVGVPGGAPLGLASGRAAGDGVPGPRGGGDGPAPVAPRGGGRPALGGAVDVDPEPAPRPAVTTATAVHTPEPARPAASPRPEPTPAARPEPTPEARPQARPEPQPEPAAEKPRAKPKPDLPNEPRLLSSARPSFPAVDKSGSVQIAIHVSASGAVTSVEVTSSSGIGGVDSAARSAGRRFRFSRAENGKTFYQTFRYSPK